MRLGWMASCVIGRGGKNSTFWKLVSAVKNCIVCVVESSTQTGNETSECYCYFDWTGWNDWSRFWGKNWKCRLRSTIRAHPIAQLRCLRRMKITDRRRPVVLPRPMNTSLTPTPEEQVNCQWKVPLPCLLISKSSDPLLSYNFPTSVCIIQIK